MAETTYLVLAHYHVQPGRAVEVIDLLGKLAEASLKEEGNRGYQYFRSATDPDELLIVERYVDAAALAVHRASEHFQEWGVGHIIPLLTGRDVEEFPLA